MTTLNNIKYLQPRLYPTEYDTAAVQATAYALLVYIQNNLFVESKSIMLWLQTMRNVNNGFEASQVRSIVVVGVVGVGVRGCGGNGYLLPNWFRHLHQLIYGNFRTYFKCNVLIMKKEMSWALTWILKLNQLIVYSDGDHSRYLEHGWRMIYVGQIELEFEFKFVYLSCSCIVMLGDSILAR